MTMRRFLSICVLVCTINVLKCELTSKKKKELNNIHINLLNNYSPGGEYTASGYQLCRRRGRRSVQHNEAKPTINSFANYNPVARVRRDLEFSHPLNVEQVARAYENSHSTTIVRDLDPANMITLDRDPVLSYTVLPTFSYLDNSQVNLPLVVRALITSHTLRNSGEREDFSPEITKHFKNMSPIEDHENYDERGHIVGSRLGGPTETYNIFPQSWKHNRGQFSRWQYFESNLDIFLRNQPNRYAEYTAVLSYKTDGSGNLVYRPTAVALRVRLYINGQMVDMRGSSVTLQNNSLENMYFTNDPANTCIIEGDHPNI